MSVPWPSLSLPQLLLTDTRNSDGRRWPVRLQGGEFESVREAIGMNGTSLAKDWEHSSVGSLHWMGLGFLRGFYNVFSQMLYRMVAFISGQSKDT